MTECKKKEEAMEYIKGNYEIEKMRIERYWKRCKEIVNKLNRVPAMAITGNHELQLMYEEGENYLEFEITEYHIECYMIFDEGIQCKNKYTDTFYVKEENLNEIIDYFYSLIGG